MLRLFRTLLIALAALALLPGPAQADPADINAAARGVVRVVIVGQTGDDLFPVSHGTGFAIGPELIVTNAHVVSEARADDRLEIGIVPSDGGSAVFGKLVAYSPRNDLALVRTTTSLNLPPLTIAGNAPTDSGEVTAVGYPMNVDRAQGLDEQDIFRATPPVKSTGTLSGRRPSRDFDTLLHTAPIARGNSGGPLLDNCGRVVGVNSFGADSGSSDAEFFFAVSTSELMPFLRENEVTPQVNGLPCRSFAELERDERDRAQRELLAARAQERAKLDEQQAKEAIARRDAELRVISERDNGMMLSILLLMVAMGAGSFAMRTRDDEDETEESRRTFKIAAAIAGAAIVGALLAWVLRPGFAEVEERMRAALVENDDTLQPVQQASGTIDVPGDESPAEDLVCVVQVERSRITSGSSDDLTMEWEDDGCVNGRTQYGLMDGEWSRVLVPNDAAEVSINTYDPGNQEYTVERYLLGRDAVTAAREARAEYNAPSCGNGDFAAQELGRNQSSITAALPSQPNERLVYKCGPASSGE
jgi:V8-like Glu-specific endopeptidase